MNLKLVLIALCVLALVPAAVNAQPAGDPSPKVVAAASDALARMEYVIDNEFIRNQRQGGQAICIDEAKGLFISLDWSQNLSPEDVKEVVLIKPGSSTTRVKAELLGVEPIRNIVFIEAKGQKDWKALKFESTANLELGQSVFSVGLLGPGVGNATYLGLARVAAKLRTPQPVVYVSGGDLTVGSSPVMTMDGKAIGLVGGEIPMEFRMLINGGWANAVMAGVQRTRFFIPVDDFVLLLADVPVKGKAQRLCWLGAVNFLPVTPEEAEIAKITKPAVKVGQVVPDSPAAKAGLEQDDVVVGMNGQPLEAMPTPELTAANFTRDLLRVKPGTEVALDTIRKGQAKTLKVTLAEMPMQGYESSKYANRTLGFAVRDLVMFDRYVGRTKPMMENGAVVIGVGQDSPAAAGTMRSDDLITAVNSKTVATVAALKTALEDLAKTAPKAPITFTIRRGDTPMQIIVTPPQQ